MELADIRRLKRLGLWPCGFEPRRPHFPPRLIHINALTGRIEYHQGVGQERSTTGGQDLLAMHIAEIDETIDAFSRDDAMQIADPRQMTRAQLRRLGVPRLVYLRCGMVDGQTAYAVHAADGTAIAVVDDVEVAVELVSDNHMIFVAVH